MTDQATPAKVRLTDGLGPLVERLRAYPADQTLCDDYCSAMLEAADMLDVYAASVEAERSSRGMFWARLENMQKNGDTWLTVPAVLALLNDCDMLAQLPSERTKAQALRDEWRKPGGLMEGPFA